ncbi:MAG: hypothetical protein A2Y15_09130 [Clostridiales bacterium GWF2_36_10]|nr:MAG: hypothetical protein A2Y15_09130 [Clostridiales bacterium GWF2_36_10]HAN21458.1 hypothetical protein [Clostridiales bacterium]
MGAFSIFTDKKKKKKYSGVPTVEEYYLKLARRTTFAKFICIMLIASFALFAFSNYKDELTIENFRYMLKFVDFGAETVQETASVVYFDSDTTNKGELLRGDLAVLNTSGIMVYDFNGDRLYKSDFKYDHPKMISNNKDMIVCDIGGYGLKIFSSYSTIYTEEFSYPIYGLDACESGGFLVLSSVEGFRSAFFVYDEFYRVVYSSSFGDKYIDCASLSTNGKEVVAMLHYSRDGDLITLLAKYSVDNQDSSIFQKEFIDEMPLKINYMADGAYAVLTNKALRFFSSDNIVTGEIFFEEKSLLGYEFSNNYAIITYNTIGLSAGTELDVYTKDASLVAVRNFEGALLDKRVSSDTLFVLSHGLLTTVDLKGVNADKTDEVENEFRQLLLDQSGLILLSDNKAEYFKKNDTTIN